MKRRFGKSKKQTQCISLLAAAALALSGCGSPMQEGNLMESIQRTDAANSGTAADGKLTAPETPVVLVADLAGNRISVPTTSDVDKDIVSAAEVDIAGKGAAALTDFGLRLFQNSFQEDKNVLVSPLSVISALAMTANGARGETLQQMEDAFGISVPELDAYLAGFMDALPENKKYKLSMANGIWFKDVDEFTVKQNFLQTNAGFFDAALYKAPFDNSTLKQINSWVKENTDGMIEQIVDEIPEIAVMYLVNALAFDAEWEEIYEKNHVHEGEFTKEDKTVQKVDFMYSSETEYLEDDRAEGFLKYYADRKYAFAALLPKEDVTVSEYIASLTGEKLQEILANPVRTKVYALIPKFECAYSAGLNEALQEMGIKEAFLEETANFTGIGSFTGQNLYISRVLHNTYIAVDERGTRAGAVTAVEMNTGGAAWDEIKNVYLDRPFVYMIIDCESGIPVFIGAVMDVK